MPTTDTADVKLITAWLVELSSLFAHPNGFPSKSDFAARAMLLREDFPDMRAFSWRAMGHVAKAGDYWPSYATLHAKLSEWWRANHPLQPLLQLEAPAGPTPEERLQAEGDALTSEEVQLSVLEIERLTGPLRGWLMRALKARLEKWAPRHVHLVPIAALDVEEESTAMDETALGRAFLAQRGRKFGEISREHLAMLRARSRA